MGVDIHIYVPLDVTYFRVQKVIGVLAGLPARMVTFYRGTGSSFEACEVDGVSFKGWNHCPAGSITLEAPKGKKLADGEGAHAISFHPATPDDRGFWNLLMSRSTPFWCALGRRLVNFVGGSAVFDDCAEAKGANICRSRRHCPVDKRGRLPEDGKQYEKFERAVFALKPLTPGEIDQARKVAAYE